MNQIAKQVRDGIFLASSRTYGETYIEPLVKYIYGLSCTDTDEDDGIDDNGLRYEITASKALAAKSKIFE